MSYRKILECSDGTVRVIDGLRELDEAFTYLFGKASGGNKTSLILIFVKGEKHRFANAENQKKWCKVYPEHHPEAPAVTEKTDSEVSG